MVKPNFAKAYSKANEILVKNGVIQSFPYSVKQLLQEQTDIRCKTFRTARNKYGISMNAFGSNSAVLIKYHGKTLLFYNEAKPNYHNSFSLLHEWGHIANGHDLDCRDKETYGCYEIESNFFAAQLLMPEQILKYLQQHGVRITVSFLMEHFGVSAEAAEKRLTTLSKVNISWRTKNETEYDDIILERYQPFIQSLIPQKWNMYDSEYEQSIQERRDSWLYPQKNISERW